MTFTILGADGFIGSHVVRMLARRSLEYRAVGRGDSIDGCLGDVIDCVGVTADFRQRPYEALEAHVSRVVRFLESSSFDSFLYLSSTRVYRRAQDGRETTVIPVDPSDTDDLYAISKLAGEAACLRCENPRVRVARLSNVYGVDADVATFLASVIWSALRDAQVVLTIDQFSARDFVAVGDVATILPAIAVGGTHRIYNVASGRNVCAGDLVREVCRLTGADFIAGGGPLVSFPSIATDRIREDLGFTPTYVADDLPALVSGYRRSLQP